MLVNFSISDYYSDESDKNKINEINNQLDEMILSDSRLSIKASNIILNQLIYKMPENDSYEFLSEFLLKLLNDLMNENPDEFIENYIYNKYSSNLSIFKKDELIDEYIESESDE